MDRPRIPTSGPELRWPAESSRHVYMRPLTDGLFIDHLAWPCQLPHIFYIHDCKYTHIYRIRKYKNTPTYTISLDKIKILEKMVKKSWKERCGKLETIKKEVEIEKIIKHVGPIWGQHEAADKIKKFMTENNMHGQRWCWSGAWNSENGTSYAEFWRILAKH